MQSRAQEDKGDSLDPEVSRAAALEEDTERRHEDGEEDLDD